MITSWYQVRWFFKLVRTTHAVIYRWSGGRVGASIAGMPMLILVTKGRRSARVHSVPLGYMMERDSYVVIASYRGSSRHPAWYLNLLNEPQAIVQVKKRRIAVVAKTADAEARERLWTCLVTRTPLYKRFQERTKRKIPMVYLTPVNSGTER